VSISSLIRDQKLLFYRLILEAFQKKKIENYVLKAYAEPDCEAHQIIKDHARKWYGLTESNNVKWSEAFMLTVFRAQLKLFGKGVDTDLGLSKIGFDDLVIKSTSTDANSSRVFIMGFDDNLTIFQIYKEQAEKGTIAVDVGANIGIHSLVLSRCVGEKGRVYAYEPRASMCARIKENLETNYISNVFIRKVAVGDQNGKIPFNEHEKDFNIGLGSYDPTSDKYVDVVKLDEDLKEVEGKISLVKIDVEGYELQVIKGMRDLLIRHKPNLVLEYNPDKWDFEALRKEIPYTVKIYKIPTTFRDKSILIKKGYELKKSTNILITPTR